ERRRTFRGPFAAHAEGPGGLGAARIGHIDRISRRRFARPRHGRRGRKRDSREAQEDGVVAAYDLHRNVGSLLIEEVYRIITFSLLFPPFVSSSLFVWFFPCRYFLEEQF